MVEVVARRGRAMQTQWGTGTQMEGVPAEEEYVYYARGGAGDGSNGGRGTRIGVHREAEPCGDASVSGVAHEQDSVFEIIHAVLCSYQNICWMHGPEARQAGKALVCQAQSLGLYGYAGAEVIKC